MEGYLFLLLVFIVLLALIYSLNIYWAWAVNSSQTTAPEALGFHFLNSEAWQNTKWGCGGWRSFQRQRARDKEPSTCRNGRALGIIGLYLDSEILKVSHNAHEEVSGIRVAARWKGINSNHLYQHHWYLWNSYCAVEICHTLYICQLI